MYKRPLHLNGSHGVAAYVVTIILIILGIFVVSLYLNLPVGKGNDRIVEKPVPFNDFTKGKGVENLTWNS